MTLTELKSLKVGQVVKYTNDVDAFNVEFWEVTIAKGNYIELKSTRDGSYHIFNTTEEDIDHFASMLTIDQPIAYKALEPQRQLKLIEAKIRDAEFDLGRLIIYNELMYKVYLQIDSAFQPKKDEIETILFTLRQQRNELI